MPFTVIYYHFVWSTKHREPLITAQIEPYILNAIVEKSSTLKCRVLAINAVPDHIHLALRLHPDISVSSWVRQVKGVSSYAVNQVFPHLDRRFHWQEGYGALTFGEKTLAFVIAYIHNQKLHHQEQTLQPYLERSE